MDNRAPTRPKSRESLEHAPARLRSLLVPLDLTPISDRVLARVARLPLANDAHIRLLHVVPGSLSPADTRQVERDAKKLLADEKHHLSKELPKSIHVDQAVTIGTPHKEIAAAARSSKAELVVMGRGGGRALRDLFLGSTAERVIRQGKLPVLVVRLAARAGYRRPALAIDVDRAAHEVIALTLRLMESTRPHLAVIHAFSSPYENLGYPSVPTLVDQRRLELQTKAARELSKLLATSLSKAKVQPGAAPVWRLLVRHGSARLVIEKAVKQLESDLLVLGTHGYAGVAHAFLGTVAGDVLREVACDVLVVPPSASRK